MKTGGGRRFVLLDRDGTLIEERHYLSRPDQVALIPGSAQGLKSLAEAGFGLVIVTNQSGLARGYFRREDLDAVHATLRGLLEREGVSLDGIYVCPHLPEAGCDCRKPLPGLALQAARELGFTPSEAVVIGDKACDVELGKNIGAATVLVATGHGAEQSEAARAQADRSVPSIVEACRTVVEWYGTDAFGARGEIRNG